MISLSCSFSISESVTKKIFSPQNLWNFYGKTGYILKFVQVKHYLTITIKGYFWYYYLVAKVVRVNCFFFLIRSRWKLTNRLRLSKGLSTHWPQPRKQDMLFSHLHVSILPDWKSEHRLKESMRANRWWAYGALSCVHLLAYTQNIE